MKVYLKVDQNTDPTDLAETIANLQDYNFEVELEIEKDVRWYPTIPTWWPYTWYPTISTNSNKIYEINGVNYRESN